jgi:hypothetical protein
MLPLLVVLLTTSSIPEHFSLLNPTAQPPPPSVRLLLVQGSSSEGAHAERILQLTREVEELNTRIRGINVNPPLISLIMASTGYILSPLLLIGVPLIYLGGLTALAPPAIGQFIIAGGVVLTVLGTGGVALLIAGIVTGLSASEAARAERTELIRQRGQLEKELRDLKRARPESSLQPWREGRTEGFIPLATLSF